MKLGLGVICDELASLGAKLYLDSPAEAKVSAARLHRLDDGGHIDSTIHCDITEYRDDCLYIFEDFAAFETIVGDRPANAIFCRHIEGRDGQFRGSNAILLDVSLLADDLFDLVLDVFDKYQGWQERMVEAILSNGTLEDLMGIACEMLANPVAIIDVSQTLMYHSENFTSGHEGTIWDELLANGIVSMNYYSAKELRDIHDSFEQDGAPLVMRPSRDPSHEQIMCPLKLEGKLVGSLGIVDVNAPFTSGQVFIAGEVARQVQSQMAQQRVPPSQENPYYLLRIIEGQEIEPLVVAHHLERRHWALDDDYYLLLFSYQVTWSYSEEGKAVMRLLHASYPYVLTCYRESRVVLVGRKKDFDAMDPAVRAKLEAFCEKNYLRCGISDCTNDFMGLRSSYAQAELALSHLAAQDESAPASMHTRAFCEGFMGYVIDALGTTTDLSVLCNPRILALWRSNRSNKKELIDSLYIYLVCGRGVAAAARKLCVHRNTLLYRLRVVSELLGVDLDSLDDDRTVQILLTCAMIGRSAQQDGRTTA